MANQRNHEQSRRRILKSAVLTGGLAGCLGSGDDTTPSGGLTDFDTQTPTESPTPTATPTPVARSDEDHQMPSDADILDRIVFGSEPSEVAHDLAPETSEVVRDQNEALGRRILQPPSPDGETIAAGSMVFTMDCVPDQHNYLTVKVPARPQNSNYLALIDENDDLVGNILADGAWPSLTNRMWGMYENGKNCKHWLHIPTHSEYVYLTARLPTYLTEGSESFPVRITQIKSNSSAPSMPILRAYTHTDAVFNLLADEATEHSFEMGTPAGPAKDPIAHQIERINSYVDKLLSRDRVPPGYAHSLALAYSRGDWIDAVDQGAIIDIVRNSLDHWTREQAESSPREVVDRGWEEHGELARALNLLAQPFRERGLLAAELEDYPEAPIQRSEAYAEFFDAGIRWRTKDLRSNYNQIALVTKNLLRANRALNTLDSDSARDQDQVDHWIDQMIGIEPTGGRGAPYPESGTFHTATEAGITKEGAEYASHYGPLGIEQTVVVAEETGLERVKERAREMVEAFGNLRWFVKGCDTESVKESDRDNLGIAPEAAIAVRGTKHIGNGGVLRGYGFSPLRNAMVLEDDVSKRWAELAIEHDAVGLDNWRDRAKSIRRRIPQVEGYGAMNDMDESEYTIPLNRDQHVWFDVDMGLVTVNDGETRFVANIPHSASTNKNDHGVNRRCAVHFHDPEQGDRVVQAHVHRLEYPYEGETWTRPDNLGWASDFLGPKIGHMPDRTRYLTWRDETKTLHNAMAGEEVPQAAQPNGDPWPEWEGDSSDPRSLSEDINRFPQNEYGTMPGSPDPRVGMGIHYREVRVGPYLIGINSTGNEQRGLGPGQDFEMEVSAAEATNLETGETVTGDTVTVPPRSGLVLKLAE